MTLPLNKIIHGDCLDVMATLPAESVDLVITSPPYNLNGFARSRRIIDSVATRRGIVLDPFMGSGTTALAAVQQNWSYIGIELSPTYCNLAEIRLADYARQPRLNLGKLDNLGDK